MSLTKAMLTAGTSEQEVKTPPEIIARVVRAFGGFPIALDPCAPTRSDPSFYAERYVREAENGLAIPWVDRTFVNPPFNDLIPWLEKAEAEGARGLRIVLLVPLRSHRRWFARAMASAGSVTLEPGVRFVGFPTAFPAPIALLSWGCMVPPAPGGIVGAFLPPDPEIRT